MTRRRLLLASLAGGLSMGPAALRAQSTVRPLVGMLSSTTAQANATFHKTFTDALQAHGYVPGRNLTIDRRYAEGDPVAIGRLAAELVAARPDVIVASGNRDIEALKRLTTTIPIVMVAGQDPVGAGFIASLARPGGNVTGMSSVAGTGIRGKRLELLKEIVPGLQRVTVLRVTGESAETLSVALAQAAAALGLALDVVEVRRPEEFDHAFRSIAERPPRAMCLDGAGLLILKMQAICDFALEHRIPTIYAMHEFTQAGLLIDYGLNVNANWRRAASYVDKILHGARPADLPVEQPSTFEMSVNLRTARAIGVKIPTSVLIRADEIIE
jgi:putative ABC transport system substrate-binding protein